MIIQLRRCLAPTCDGAAHEWEFEDFTVQELRRLQKTFGTEISAFLEGIDKGDLSEQALDSIVMLLVLMHRRIGIAVGLDDMDFHMGDFAFVIPDEPEAEEKPTEPTLTSPLPEGEPAMSSTSGPAPGAESTPRSSTTPPDSGGASG